MTGIYGIAVLIGAIGVLAAIGLALNPARPPLDRRVRYALLAVFGFGIAGISSSFAGWPAGLTVLAALGGAAALLYLGARYGTVSDMGDSAELE